MRLSSFDNKLRAVACVKTVSIVKLSLATRREKIPIVMLLTTARLGDANDGHPEGALPTHRSQSRASRVLRSRHTADFAAGITPRV